MRMHDVDIQAKKIVLNTSRKNPICNQGGEC